MRRRLIRPGAACLGVLFIVLGGCRSVPDLTPFAEATAQVQRGMGDAGDMIDEMLVLAGKTRGSFNETWQIRVDLAAHLTDYADSLASIAEAGRTGREGATALGQALEPLFGAAGASGLAGSAVFQVGTELYAHIAEAMAAASLEKAVDRADPIIAGVSDLLIKDLASIDAALQTSAAPMLLAVDDRHEEAIALRGQRSKIADRRDALIRSLSDASVDPAAASRTLVDLAGVLANVDEAVQAYEADQRAVTEGVHLRRAAIAQMQVALRQLAATHHDLGLALKQRRPPNYRALVESAQRIKAILDSAKARSM